MSRPPHVDLDAPPEDTGKRISRCEATDTPTSAAEDLSTKTEETLEMRVVPPSCHPTNGMDNGMCNFFC